MGQNVKNMFLYKKNSIKNNYFGKNIALAIQVYCEYIIILYNLQGTIMSAK